MAPRLYADFNRQVFDGRLPTDLPIEWNVKLQRTAGYCKFTTVGGQRHARIELSSKVIDRPERLRKTLEAKARMYAKAELEDERIIALCLSCEQDVAEFAPAIPGQWVVGCAIVESVE